jgi:hypothetical protein
MSPSSLKIACCSNRTPANLEAFPFADVAKLGEDLAISFAIDPE